MNATQELVTEAHLLPMDNRGRGMDIKRRRLALDINNMVQFAELTGRDRKTLSKVEAGEDTVAQATYDWIESWLERMEEENGLDQPGEIADPIRITFRDVTTSSIGEIIVEGPTAQSDELVATISRLLAEVRKGGQE